MGIAERKEREKEQRRNDIIDAAEWVFFSKGRTVATMDDVAEKAELSKGTLYLYFKNKEELYLAICLRGLKILESYFNDAVKRHKTGIQKIRAIGNAYHQFSLDHPDYFNALIYFESHEMDYEDESSTAVECDNQGHKVLQIVTDTIQHGIVDGTIRTDLDPLKTAAILWGQTSGLIQLISLKGDHLQQEHGLNKDDLITYAFDLIEQSLQK